MRTLWFVAVASLATSQGLSAGEEMQKLFEALSGRWSITSENTRGETAKGEEAWYAAPGGTPLVEEYRVKDSRGRDVADYAAVWWDSVTRRYSGIWCADFTDEVARPSTLSGMAQPLRCGEPIQCTASISAGESCGRLTRMIHLLRHYT